MDHAEAGELLETAAVEPGGLDRLMAGDTVESRSLAGHLAGCAECAEELARISRDAGVIRSLVRSLPPADLRERTLAYVAALGRERSAARSPTAASPAAGSPAAGLSAAGSPLSGVAAPEPERFPGPSPADVAPPEPEPLRSAAPAPARRGPAPAWLAAIAAVLIAAVVGTALLVGGQRDARITALEAELGRRADAVSALQRVAAAGLRVAAEPDAAHVALVAPSGSAANGSLVFSPATGELVVIASGLDEPAAGRELRCWVEVDGERRSVGRMFFAGDLSFWTGPVEDLAGLPAGARFGVTLVDPAGGSLDGNPVLSGAL